MLSPHLRSGRRNKSLPPVAWLLINSGMANATGDFQLSNLQATSFPIRFYRITSQQ